MKQISLNFGAIKDSILRFSSKEFINESGEKNTILNNFLTKLKEDPIQKIQYLIFKNLEEGSFKKERLAERYINQNIKLLESITWDQIINSNRDIRIGLLENCHVEGDTAKSTLYENIHTLIESNTRKGFSNIDQSESAYESILEHLMAEKVIENKTEGTIEENDNPKIFSWDFITKLAVNNFNKRYSHLNESEQSLLKILLSTEENKKNHLKDLKSENLETINRILSESEINEITEKALLDFKSKLETIESDNLEEAIINCAELKESLGEIES